MKRQVIICQTNAYVVSNTISDFVPLEGSTIMIERNTYKVVDVPFHILRSKPSENLLKDAAIIVAQTCIDELDYQRKLTPENLKVAEGTGQQTTEPDVVTIVGVKLLVPANLFYEVEAKRAAKLAEQE